MSKNDEEVREPDVRINLSLFRDEYPALTIELLGLRKGSPRTNRLASLASIGLMAEQQIFPKPGSQRELLAPTRRSGIDQPSVNTRVTNGHTPKLSAFQIEQLTGTDDE